MGLFYRGFVIPTFVQNYNFTFWGHFLQNYLRCRRFILFVLHLFQKKISKIYLLFYLIDKIRKSNTTSWFLLTSRTSKGPFVDFKPSIDFYFMYIIKNNFRMKIACFRLVIFVPIIFLRNLFNHHYSLDASFHNEVGQQVFLNKNKT